MSLPLMQETVWFDKHRYDDAEKAFEEQAAQERKKTSTVSQMEKPKSNNSLAEQIANARQRIINTLQAGDNIAEPEQTTATKECESHSQLYLNLLEEHKDLKKLVGGLIDQLKMLTLRMDSYEKMQVTKTPIAPAAEKEEKIVANSTINNHNEEEADDDDDDDIDLFGSDEEDNAANRLREQRLKEYEIKKSKKSAVIAKSSVVLDIKPWDDETDLKDMETRVRRINSDGLKWGASKLVPLAYGIKKLQIVCVVEDDKVSIDWLQETIQESIEDLVQSVDIAAFNKL